MDSIETTLEDINLMTTFDEIEEEVEQALFIDETKCLSIKNSKTFIQCPCARKVDSLFCGRHARAKKVQRYDEYLFEINTITNSLPLPPSPLNIGATEPPPHSVSTEEIIKDNVLSINDTLCLSIKNSKTFTQCPCLRKEGSLFCGRHSRAKKVKRYDEYIKGKNTKTPKIPITKKLKKKIKIKKKKINIIETIEDFMRCYQSLKVIELRDYIIKFNLNELIGDNRKKKDVILCLTNYFQIYEDCLTNLAHVIKCQAFLRGCITRIRTSCNNDTDFMLMEELTNIPTGMFIRLLDKYGFWYGFDISSLKELLKGTNLNPYTREEFSLDNLRKIHTLIKYLEEDKKVSLKLEEDILSPDQEIQAKAVSVFQKFDFLGNYTDHMWFMNLSMNRLKRLYREAEDMWNYRIQLPMSERMNIVKNGKAFAIPYIYIDHMHETNKIELQHLILDQFNRFITEGIDEETRKMGAMWMLSSLVIVSEAAAEAMPQYIQNFA